MGRKEEFRNKFRNRAADIAREEVEKEEEKALVERQRQLAREQELRLKKSREEQLQRELFAFLTGFQEEFGVRDWIDAFGEVEQPVSVNEYKDFDGNLARVCAKILLGTRSGYIEESRPDGFTIMGLGEYSETYKSVEVWKERIEDVLWLTTEVSASDFQRKEGNIRFSWKLDFWELERPTRSYLLFNRGALYRNRGTDGRVYFGLGGRRPKYDYNTYLSQVEEVNRQMEKELIGIYDACKGLRKN